jgi:SAM-dependent methyltransferase
MDEGITFGNSPHAIYVNAHHRDVHYRRIAEDILRYMPANARALDYGCGEALHADIPAKVARQFLLCEAAPRLRETLTARYAGDAKIQVVSPEEVEALGKHSLDLIVMHSVAQYLTREELDKLFVLFHRLLKGDGLFVLGDVIPPQVSALTDALALLRFSREEGFFVVGPVRIGAHSILELLGFAFDARTYALRQRRNATQAHSRRLLGGARTKEHRSQPGTHDISRAA